MDEEENKICCEPFSGIGNKVYILAHDGTVPIEVPLKKIGGTQDRETRLY